MDVDLRMGDFQHAIDTICAQWADSDSLYDASTLWQFNSRKTNVCGRAGPHVIWGVVAEIGDIWTQQFQVGNLSMDAVDYGDRRHLSQKMQQMSGEGDPTENNQCAVFPLEEALEWKSQTCKKKRGDRSAIPWRSMSQMLSSYTRTSG